MNLQFLLVIYYLTLVRKSLVLVQTLIYIYTFKYIYFRNFKILRYLVALICRRVHSPLFFCHFSTTIFHIRGSVADHFVTSQVFSHEISRSESLCHFSTATFSHWVSRSWSWHQKLCAGWWPVSPQLIFIVSVVDFCSTSRFYIYIVCGDRSGSLSGGAFNQLRLVTLNIVLIILY